MNFFAPLAELNLATFVFGCAEHADFPCVDFLFAGDVFVVFALFLLFLLDFGWDFGLDFVTF